MYLYSITFFLSILKCVHLSLSPVPMTNRHHKILAAHICLFGHFHFLLISDCFALNFVLISLATKPKHTLEKLHLILQLDTSRFSFCGQQFLMIILSFSLVPSFAILHFKATLFACFFEPLLPQILCQI